MKKEDIKAAIIEAVKDGDDEDVMFYATQLYFKDYDEQPKEKNPPYMRITSNAYEVSLPYDDGEIEVESDDGKGDSCLWFTKNDLFLMLKRFYEKK